MPALQCRLFSFPLEDDGLALLSRFGEAWACVAFSGAAFAAFFSGSFPVDARQSSFILRTFLRDPQRFRLFQKGRGMPGTDGAAPAFRGVRRGAVSEREKASHDTRP